MKRPDFLRRYVSGKTTDQPFLRHLVPSRAWNHGAGTASEFRGRGLQIALLRARLAAAAEAGCEYAVVVTQGGTTSQRNCERLGFRVAYSKVTVIKELEKA